MRPVSTHFEQIPLEVVKKIAAETPTFVRRGRRVRRSDAGMPAPLSSREGTTVPVLDACLEDPPDRGVR
jgi:hypothetical protein